MESPTISSGNTEQITSYTLLERVRDCEYPDTLYAERSEECTGKYWYEDGNLHYEGERKRGSDRPFEAFLADYYDDAIELRFDRQAKGKLEKTK